MFRSLVAQACRQVLPSTTLATIPCSRSVSVKIFCALTQDADGNYHLNLDNARSTFNPNPDYYDDEELKKIFDEENKAEVGEDIDLGGLEMDIDHSPYLPPKYHLHDGLHTLKYTSKGRLKLDPDVEYFMYGRD